MNQVAIREESNFEMILKDVETMQNMCAQLMKSKHYQVMGEAGIFAIVQKAKALNINPLEALNGSLYFINGKIGMSSEMMASLIRQAGHSIIKDAKSNDSICILHGKRRDNGDTWHVSFSMEDAKRAGLAKNMYDKYPAVMLYNRCMSMLARQLFPDVIKGAGYTHEELMEIKENKDHKFASLPQIHETTVEVMSEEKKLNLSEQIADIQELLKQCRKDFIVNCTNYIIKIYGTFDKMDQNGCNAILNRINEELQEIDKQKNESEKAHAEMDIKAQEEVTNAA